jgi:hypothetical protein
VKLNPGLLWQNQRSKRRSLRSPAAWNWFQVTSWIKCCVRIFMVLKLETAESRSKTIGTSRNVVLEKD